MFILINNLMIDLSKHVNLYILEDKNSTYHTISKFMRFLSEEHTILYLDFSYFKNKAIDSSYLTYRSISYEMSTSPSDFKEFLITNLRNVDIVVIDINGVHNMELMTKILPTLSKVNLNILCLKKRADKILGYDFRFDEVYLSENDKLLTISDGTSVSFESFKTQYIRNIKLDNLDLDL